MKKNYKKCQCKFPLTNVMLITCCRVVLMLKVDFDLMCAKKDVKH